MNLSSLVDHPLESDHEIKGITADSREVEEGFLFAALAGANGDGVNFIPQAIDRGAVAVLAGADAELGEVNATVIRDGAPRQALAHIAARFYPKQPEHIVAITGTNGKTSTAWFLSALWRRAGINAGSLGTLGARADGFDQPLQHTTPDPVTLHKTLHAMAEAGVTHLAMEASSHALAQYRMDGARLAGAGFCNITQDHLDYHADFDDYIAAKKRLFEELTPSDGFAAVNADGAGADGMVESCRSKGLSVVTTGQAGQYLKMIECVPQADGLSIGVDIAMSDGGRRRADAKLKLVGAFQAENALLAAGLAIGGGMAAEQVFALLEGIEAPPGRMELAGVKNGASVFVDYAHTPDAVATALRAIRPHAAGRVIIVLGAGGDRDKEKRPLMGRAATAGADIVIITDDNPRSEDPAAIRAEVENGAKDAVVIGGRAEAIHHGVGLLRDGDVLLIAGKGHEQGQTIAGVVHPFDDATVAREALGAARDNIDVNHNQTDKAEG